MSSTDTPANVIQKAAAPQERLRLTFRDPRSVALSWLAGYLAISACVLAVGGHGLLIGAHVVVIGITVWSSMSASRFGRVLGDLLPLFVAPVLYAEIPQLIASLSGAGGATYHDSVVQGWELSLFGVQPSHTLAAWMPVVAVSEILHAGYLAYYAAIFIPPLALFVRGERKALGQTVLALTITYTVCWTIFALAPVEGPRYLWGAAPTVPDGPIRRFTLSLLAAGSSRGAAFPSSHMAIAVVQTVMAYRWQRRMAWGLAVVALLVGVGAVYGGFHYAVDVIAGTVLGTAIGIAVLSHYRKTILE